MWNFALLHPYLFTLLALLVPSINLLGIAIVAREISGLIKNCRAPRSSFLDLMADGIKKMQAEKEAQK